MDPITTLMNEHRIIEDALDAMERWCGETLAKATDDRRELGRFLTFIERFVDECHHGKEETILFETMIRHGFPKDAGPVGVMLHEHDEGRSLVAGLRSLAMRDAPWSDKERRRLAELVRAYAEMLRQHIMKEDRILYPMALSRLPGYEQDAMGERFDRFEDEETGPGEHQRLHALVDALIAAHPPPIRRSGCGCQSGSMS
jgi:hemerythrin-like domain-containing protein